MNRIITTVCAVVGAIALIGQYAPPDSSALEAIIVERYYYSDAQDASDEDGGELVEGSFTYRVFADMKPGYNVNAVFGNDRNLLLIKSSTAFFNNEDRGEETGDAIDNTRLGDNTVALDSWVTIGAASDIHLGVLKEDDTDGSIVGGTNNDGGSEGIAGGLLVNDNEAAGIPLTTADGLEDIGSSLSVSKSPGLALDMFADENSEDSLKVGGVEGEGGDTWFVPEGVWVDDGENLVMLGQFTTDGTLTFCMNVQVGIPDSLQCNSPDCHSVIQYVNTLHPDDAVQSVETDNIYLYPPLKFNSNDLVGLEDLDSDMSLEFGLFPNPTTDVIRITVPEVDGPLSYHILDMDGRVVRSVYMGNVQYLGEGLQVDLSDFASGMYSILVQTASATGVKRVIKR